MGLCCRGSQPERLPMLLGATPCRYGGPVAIIWGWPVVSFFTLLVALR